MKGIKITLAIVLTLIVLIIVTSIYLVKRQEKLDKRYQQGIREYGSWIRGPESDEKARQTRAKYIERSLMIREGFEKWAKLHKNEIEQCLDPKSTEKELLSLYMLIPNDGKESGVDFNRINDPYSPGFLEEEGEGNKICFSWQAYKPKSKPEPGALSDIKNKFREFHDFSIAGSGGAGTAQIIVWVSGRITELTQRQQHIPGKPTLVYDTPIEIRPRYDFLR
jgi:hypothetical protein